MRVFIPHPIHCSRKTSRHRGRMKKRAISSVISTVILTSVMISIAIMAMGFASNIFAIESQSVEFDQAKNTMVNFAGIVEQVSSSQGSSGYVLFNTRSGGPTFLSNVGTINVTLSGTNIAFIYGSNNSITGSYNTLKYRGGSLSSVGGKSYLKGAEGIITYNNNITLGSVYVEQASGSWVVLDYARIGVLNLGVFNFSTGINSTTGVVGFEKVNLVQVQYLNITKGSFSGSGSIYTVATCKNIYINYTRVKTTQPINYDLIVTVKLAPAGTPITSSLGVFLNNTYDTIIMVVNSEVEVSMFGG